MYDENSFKNYIFWLKVKRVFLIIVLSCIGAALGIVISQFFIDVLLLADKGSKTIIIVCSTILFFGISLLLTAGTGKEVQEGYWKMAVLRKLTVISKKLDYLENINTDNLNKIPREEVYEEVVKNNVQENITKETSLIENEKNLPAINKTNEKKQMSKKPNKSKIKKVAKNKN